MPSPDQTASAVPGSSFEPLPTNLPAAAGSAFSGASILNSIQRAKSSLADTMRIEPKVIPAADPVKLDNRPADTSSVAADLHYHAGRMFETQGSPGAIELNPGDGSSYNDLAMCHARHGNLDIALGTLQRAIKLEPGNKLYRNNLALVLVDAGRQQEAYQHLVAAHGEAIAHYNLGYMLLERKSTEAAASHFREALSLNPQLAVARQLLDELQRTTAKSTPAPTTPTVSAFSEAHPSLTRLPSPTTSR
jgi:tetratricopeptide (TPR) repeat protein